MKRILLTLLIITSFFAVAQKDTIKATGFQEVVQGHQEALSQGKPTKRKLALASSSYLRPEATKIGVIKPFTNRVKAPDATNGVQVRGNITFAANNILTENNSNQAYNGGRNNNGVEAYYINVDPSGSNETIFSSSSSDLKVPDCSKVVYAGLYWGALYNYTEVNSNVTSVDSRYRPSSTYDHLVPHIADYPYDNIKFKLPGTSNYIDVKGDIINDNLTFKNPYVCYADMTAVVKANVASGNGHNGRYTAANIRASLGKAHGSYGGQSAGWTLVVIYENKNESNKKIYVYDGYQRVYRGESEPKIQISGFRTFDNGPVNIRLMTGTLEGDYFMRGDKYEIECDGCGPGGTTGFRTLQNATNFENNFFNSSISIDGTNSNPVRFPHSKNNFGLDVDLFNLSNPDNKVIRNGQTDMTIRFKTKGDGYMVFLNAFAVEVIEPEILMVKTIDDGAVGNVGTNHFAGQNVTLGDTMWYDIAFTNTGTDDAKDTYITDILPRNVIVLEKTTSTGGVMFNGKRYDFDVPVGVTIHSIEEASVSNNFRAKVVFKIPDNYVTKGHSDSELIHRIRMHVTVQPDCKKLVDVCSDLITNQASADCVGIEGGSVVEGVGSYSGFSDGACHEPLIGASNILVNYVKCPSDRKICVAESGQTTLIAGAGFDEYVWYNYADVAAGTNGEIVDNPSGATPIYTSTSGADNTFTVTGVGVYVVYKTTTQGCNSLQEVFTVEDIDAVNPLDVDGFADVKHTLCNQDGSYLIDVYLCGVDDEKTISLNLGQGAQVEWQKLKLSKEPPVDADGVVIDPNHLTCPYIQAQNQDWDVVSSSTTATFNTKGYYRLKLTDGGCDRHFYFNVYKGDLNINVIATDIICKKKGTIEVTGVSSDMQIAFVELNVATDLNTPGFTPAAGDYQNINLKDDIDHASTWGVYVKSTTSTCNSAYTVSISEKDLEISAVSNNVLCNGDTGNITASVSTQLAPGARYNYTITKKDGSGNLTSTTQQETNQGTTVDFTNLATGDYQLRVESVDATYGCDSTYDFEVADSPPLDVTLIKLSDIICDSGRIAIKVSGGNTNPTSYSYAVWKYVKSADADPSVSNISYASPADININSIYDDFDPDGVAEFEVPESSPGVYTFIIYDSSNCKVISDPIEITIDENGFDFVPVVVNFPCGQDVGASVTFLARDSDGILKDPSVVYPGYVIKYKRQFKQWQSSNVYIANTPGYLWTNRPVPFKISIKKGRQECIIKKDVVVAKDPSFTSTGEPIVTDANCIVETGTIEIPQPADAATVTYQYGYKTDPLSTNYTWQNSNIITGRSPGTYYLAIKNNNSTSCKFQYADPVEISAIREIPEFNEPNLNTSCGGGLEFTMVPTNSSALISGLTYELYDASDTLITDEDGSSTNLTIKVANVASGTTYYVKVSEGSCSRIVPVTITFAELDAEVKEIVHETCPGAKGKMVVRVINYTGTIEYQLNSGPAWVSTVLQLDTSGHSVFEIPNLSPGTYSVTIRTPDEQCSKQIPGTVRIEDGLGITVTRTITQPSCIPGSSPKGKVTLSATGGVKPYKFTITKVGGSALPIATQGVGFANVDVDNLDIGEYTISVEDSSVGLDGNGCNVCIAGCDNFEIKEAIKPTFTHTIDCNGKLTITVTDGAGPYMFHKNYTTSGTLTWDNQSSTDSRDYTLATGQSYNIAVKGANGCVSDPIVITDYQGIGIDFLQTPTNISCKGDAGEIQVKAVGGDGSYTFTIDPALPTGATATLTSSSGTLNDIMTYAFPDGAEDSYTITVTTGDNCSVDISHNLTKETGFSVIASNIQNPDCNGDTGSVVLTITNGTAPYIMTSSKGGTLTQVVSGNVINVTGLLSGQPNTITITDDNGNGCENTVDVIIDNVPDPIIGGTVTTEPAPCSSDPAVNVGKIIFTPPTGGTPPYTYSVNGLTGPFVPITDVSLSNVILGTHTPVVKDSKGCTLPYPDVNIEDSTIPAMKADLEYDPCDGNARVAITRVDGDIDITGITFTVTKGGTTYPAVGSSVNIFENLPSGIYSAVITKGACTSTLPFVVKEDQGLVVANVTRDPDPICFGSNDGEIKFTIENAATHAGTTAIPVSTTTYYTIDGGTEKAVTILSSDPDISTNNTFTVTDADGYGAGPHTVKVYLKNASGTAICEQIITVTIQQPTSQLDIDATKMRFVGALKCVGTSSIIIVPKGLASDPSTTGGSPPYTYSYTSDNPYTTSSTWTSAVNDEFDIGTAGTYTVRVEDANGCFAYDTFEISSPASVDFTAVVQNPCDNSSDGQITVTASGGPTDPDFEFTLTPNFGSGSPIVVDPSPNTNVYIFENLLAGDYTVTVKELKSDCSATPQQLTINAKFDFEENLVITPFGCAGTSSANTATIEVKLKGGTGNYVYALLNRPSATAPADSSSATFTALSGTTSGTAPNIITTATISVPTGMVSDFYDLLIRDNSGNSPYCEIEYLGFEVKNPSSNPIDFNYEITEPLCSGEANGALTIKMFDDATPDDNFGTPSYTGMIIYQGTDPVTDPDFVHYGDTTDPLNPIPLAFTGNQLLQNSLKAGDYEVTIVDANGCEKKETITIVDPAPLDLIIESFAPADCTGPLNLQDIGFRVLYPSPYTYGTDRLEIRVSGESAINVPTPATPPLASTGDWESFTGTREFRGYNYGDEVYVTIRRVDVDGNEICPSEPIKHKIAYSLIGLAFQVNYDPANCNSGVEVKVKAQAGTGVHPYTFGIGHPLAPGFTWETSDLPSYDPLDPNHPTNGREKTYSNLIPGVEYDFFVKDGNGCIKQNNKKLDDLVSLPLPKIIVSRTFEVCQGSTSGTIRFDITDVDPTASGITWQLYEGVATAGAGPGTIVPGATGSITPPFNNANLLGIQTTGNIGFTYRVVVSIDDAAGITCKYGSADIDMIASQDINATIKQTKMASCVDITTGSSNNDGIIEVYGYGGAGGFTYAAVQVDAANYVYDVSTNTYTLNSGYTPAPADPAWISATPPAGSPVFTASPLNVQAGFVDVYAADSKGCIKFIETFYVLPTPRFVIVETTPDVCRDNPKFTIKIGHENTPTHLGGYNSRKYSYGYSTYDSATSTWSPTNWTSPINEIEYAYNNLNGTDANGSPVTYRFSVRDRLGCEVSEDFDVYPGLEFIDRAIKDFDCSATGSTAEVELDITVGSGDYSFIGPSIVPISTPLATMTLNPADYVGLDAEGNSTFTTNNPVFIFNQPGDYTFIIRDNNAKCDKEYTITVKPKNEPSFTTEVIDVKCTGDSNGKIFITPTGGIRPIQYEITYANPTLPASYNTIAQNEYFNNLPAGEYRITATSLIMPSGTSGNGCTYESGLIIINEPVNGININSNAIIVEQFGCVPTIGSEVPSIKIDLTNVSGGNGVYSKVEFHKIINYTTLAETTQLVYTDTMAPFEYVLDEAVDPTVITGGDFYVDVYDINGCFKREHVYIKPFNRLMNPFVTVEKEIDCSGGEDIKIVYANSLLVDKISAVEILLNGVNTGYTSSHIDTSVTPQGPIIGEHVFTNLPPDLYVITMTNIDTGCVIDVMHEVKEEPTSDYTVDVTVKDGYVCSSDPLDKTSQIEFQLTTSSTASYGPYTDTYNYEVVNIGNVAVASGVVNNPASIITLTDEIPAGFYTVKVKLNASPDCTISSTPFYIYGPQVDLSVSSEKTNPSCTGKLDGIIQAIGSGGFDDYTYKLELYGSGGSLSQVRAFDANPLFITNLGAGTYKLTVKDINECEASVDVILADPDPVNFTVEIDNKSCDREGATIEINPTGGTNVLPAVAVQYTYVVKNTTTGIEYTNNIGNFYNMKPGDYDVSVTDLFTCSAANQTVTVFGDIAYDLVRVKNLGCQPSPGDLGEVSIEMVPNSGSGTYEYEVSGPNGFALLRAPMTATNTTFTVPSEGLYTVKVYDMGVPLLPGTTECAAVKEIDFEPAAGPLYEVEKIDITCFNSNDGRIVIKSLDNGTLPYTFTLLPNHATYDASTSSFDGLQPSVQYQVVAKSTTTECVVNSDIIEFAQPTEVIIAPDAVINIPAFACTQNNTVNYAMIALDQSKITFDSSREIIRVDFIDPNGDVVQTSRGSFSYTVTNFDGGTYKAIVYDSSDCSDEAEFEIEPYKALEEIAITVDEELNCSTGEKITVEFTSANNSLPAAEITIRKNDLTEVTAYPDDGILTATKTFENLVPGIYVVRVENPLTGCYIEKLHLVEDEPDFHLYVEMNKVSICADGGVEGKVTLTFGENTPYTNAYDYNVFAEGTTTNPIFSGQGTGSTPTVIDNLGVGRYYIKLDLTEDPFCSPETAVFEIEAPEEWLSLDVSPKLIGCEGEVEEDTNDLNVDDNEEDDSSDSGSGDTVDGNDDAEDDSNDPDNGGGAEDSKPLDPTKGGLILNSKGGYGDYQYQVKKDGTIIQDFDYNSRIFDLDAGEYEVTVRDSSGCEVVEVIVLDTPEPITDALIEVTDLYCFGEKSATLEVKSAVGGQGDPIEYFYSLIYPDGTETATQKSPIFNNLGAGDYLVVVHTPYNCSTEFPQTITSPDEVKIIASFEGEISCENETVKATIATEGGTEPYEYSIDYGITWQPENVFEVKAGTHSFIARDKNGCISALPASTIKVAPLEPLTIEVYDNEAIVNCNGESGAKISATVLGGLGEYEYELLNADDNTSLGTNNDGTFRDLAIGNYKISVTSKDCPAAGTVETRVVEIVQPKPLEVEVIATPESCPGAEDGIITITKAKGGNGEYVFRLSTDPENKFTDVPVFKDLAPGSYDVFIVDRKACVEVVTVVVGSPEPLSVTLEGAVNKQICITDPLPTFTVKVQGGVNPYTINLNGENPIQLEVDQTEYTFTVESGQTYAVLVTDVNGCNQVEPLIITVPEAIDYEFKVDYSFDCETAEYTVVGTVADKYKEGVIYTLYDNTYDGSNVTGVLESNDIGIFKVPTDGSNYFVGIEYTGATTETERCTPDGIEIIAPLTDGILTAEYDDKEKKNTVIIKPSGGVAPYTISVDGGEFTDSLEIEITEDKTFNVLVRDSAGCEYLIEDIEVTFIEFEIPNFFTPDGDGVNDYWYPYLVESYHNMEVIIYDRYNRKLAIYNNIVNGWDGTFNGKDLPRGDYWYTIHYTDIKGDKKKLIGHFTLYRKD